VTVLTVRPRGLFGSRPVVGATADRSL
jgi:hypothetical protein